MVTVTAFIGAILGSYCGYLFNPDGLGYLSMATTILGVVTILIKVL